MSKLRIVSATLAFLLLPALAGAAGSEVLDWAADGSPRILKGADLGTLDSPMLKRSGPAFEAAAKSALDNILTRDFNSSGTEEMIPTKVTTGEFGSVHVRFEQRLNGLPVAGAAMVLHANADGTIFGVNGEFLSGKAVPAVPRLNAETAIRLAKIAGRRLSQPKLTYVFGNDGRGHLAWQVTVAYRSKSGPQRDIVFADALSGALVARHPQIYSSRSLDTKDCGGRKRCSTVSTSPNPISTGDAAIDDAHNYAIATYDYYFSNHGRDSIDNAGMTLVSRVHYDRNYNNAYWDGTQMTYGDGDGVTFSPLSGDADVVAHELTHGVTERSSGLIYASESGALNEAWSDIFGALVDRQEGATGSDIWTIGEDVYTPGTPGDGLRYMDDPTADGYSADYYPERLYAGSCSPSSTNDSCGVHGNSGIANLAFQLLVDGGTHPRGKTSVNVTGIGFSAAADIFYAANTQNCMTPNSNFAAARYCTADVFGGSYAAEVHAAWDAVGVPNDPPAPPPASIVLTDGQSLGSQDAVTGTIQQYTLDVGANKSVTCSTSCSNGDADLYLRFGAAAEANPNSTNNECGSYTATSNEECTTGASSGADTLFAGVHAYDGYTNLTITCTSADAGSCDPAGSACGNCCNGCSGGKPSSRVCL